MDDQTLRYIDLTRADDGRYQATNRRGGVLPIGDGDDTDFTPVELLLDGAGRLRGDRHRPDHRQAGHAGVVRRPRRGPQDPRRAGQPPGRPQAHLSTSPSPRARTATRRGISCRARWSRPATGSARSAAPSRSASRSSTSRPDGPPPAHRTLGVGATAGRPPVRGHRGHERHRPAGGADPGRVRRRCRAGRAEPREGGGGRPGDPGERRGTPARRRRPVVGARVRRRRAGTSTYSSTTPA